MLGFENPKVSFSNHFRVPRMRASSLSVVKVCFAAKLRRERRKFGIILTVRGGEIL